MADKPKLFDPSCKRTPDQISEYVEFAEMEGVTPEEYVWAEEGTLNTENGHFLCTDCYMKAGMPSSPTGWRCP